LVGSVKSTNDQIRCWEFTTAIALRDQNGAETHQVE
jgi:hypothetical protein